jgi:hypothetical protein
MAAEAKPSISVAEAAENLVSFALERSEPIQILNQLPPDGNLNLTAMEYEIRLLKILTVGWAIAFFSDPGGAKNSLTEIFWNSIHSFALNLSSLSSASMGKDFNYFDVLKERLEAYVAELQKVSQACDPTAVIGPRFAEFCGHKDHPLAIQSGRKIFQVALSGVRTYLESVDLTELRKQDQ